MSDGRFCIEFAGAARELIRHVFCSVSQDVS